MLIKNTVEIYEYLKEGDNNLVSAVVGEGCIYIIRHFELLDREVTEQFRVDDNGRIKNVQEVCEKYSDTFLKVIGKVVNSEEELVNALENGESFIILKEGTKKIGIFTDSTGKRLELVYILNNSKENGKYNLDPVFASSLAEVVSIE